MTLVLNEGSLFTRLGVDPSGVVLSSPESVDTNVRPELSEVGPEASDGDDIPDRKLLLPDIGGGYKGLNASLSSSNSSMIKFDSRAASVLSPESSKFPGAVI